MKIIIDNPPNMDELDAQFQVRGRPIIYAWGDVIYNPLNVVVPPQLRTHEAVHCRRQRALEGGPEEWWRRYLDDPEFRLAEELVAHQAEYLTFVGLKGANRKRRRAYLNVVAERLAGEMYGRLVTRKQAMKLITGPVDPEELVTDG